MAVDHVRNDLQVMLPQYQLISDVIAGEVAIKAAGDKYLPRPNSQDTSPENRARYDAYVTRAVFYGVTSRTLRELVGQVFRREPEYDNRTDLEAVLENANGAGVTLEQLATKAIEAVCAFGRGGLLVDYPRPGESLSREEMEQGFVRPIIRFYQPWDIINWRCTTIGAKEVVTLVVLKELIEKETDSFELLIEPQYRVLRLQDGVVTKAVMKTAEVDGQRGYLTEPSQVVVDVNGEAITEIPFEFLGSENNDPEIDFAPLYDMASLNVAHFRNSADYEESTFIVGQPTPWIQVDHAWMEQYYSDHRFPIGSRAAVTIPIGGAFGIEQVQPNSMVFEAMQHKERQMISLGAKLVEQSQVQQTATQTASEERAEMSTLESVSKNVSDGLGRSLSRYLRFATGKEETIKYELNSDFELAAITAEKVIQVQMLRQEMLLSTTESRRILKKAGYATQTDEEFKAEIAEYEQEELDRQKQITELTMASELQQQDAAPGPDKAPAESA